MQYIGIDLGTTNSAICSFDGKDTRIWKSPEQNSVTPSAIYVDRRGHRYYGRRAYEMAPTDEKNAATLFKRYLGTSMRFTLERTGESLTPEECSAEILRVLYGYLPQEWQQSPDTATVITVPAAFNQMKKDATMEAARLARIGQVALMQEPVAAVMSVMKESPLDGAFLIFDLGGGTFDVSVAEHLDGQVRLLSQGGKEMCGGRDWDRLLLRNLVIPWLQQHFHLPDSLAAAGEYRRLRQLALFACEQAKIELSSREEAYIQMDETVIRCADLDGKEIYLDLSLTREQMNGLITDLMAETVSVSREVIRKSGLRSEDLKKIVFVGGPTVYPPLQQYVMNALHLTEKGSADPMTAVAEGAAIYAESIDWTREDHRRQETLHLTEESDFKIRYEQRVSAPEARIAVLHRKDETFFAEITAEADGWSSGRMRFEGRGILTVPVRSSGENFYRLDLFDAAERPVSLKDPQIRIRRVAASVTAVPSSHAVAIKALDRVGGHAVPVYLVLENERLPKRGSVTLRSGKRLIAGSSESLVFTLWEGEIKDPIEDNRYIGTYRIPGTSFSSGVVAVGAEVICEYEFDEAGHLNLGVAIPSVGAVFAKQNYYSRTEGQTDLSDPSGLMRTANSLENRILVTNARIVDANMIRTLDRLRAIRQDLASEDPEVLQEAASSLLECQKAVARFRQEHLKEFRVMDLNGYRGVVQQYWDDLSDEDRAMLNGLYDSARQAIEHYGETYESILAEYRSRSWHALRKCDRFLREQFEIRISRPNDYQDPQRFNALKAQGLTLIENRQFRKLEEVIGLLNALEKPHLQTSENMYEQVNVLKG